MLKLKSNPVKLFLLVIGLVMISFFSNWEATLMAKAQSISFPGVTHVHLDRSMKDLRLEMRIEKPDLALIHNLNSHKIKTISSLFIDKRNNLMVVIGEKIEEQRLVFIVIKNNQVTQLQKINEITNKNIILQYGKIVLNSEVATAATLDLSNAL